MNKAQEKAVQYIRSRAMEEFDYSRGAGKFEIKKFDVTEYESFVSVYAVVGMVDDEGTMAEIICRDKVHIFIGKRGGMTYPVWRNHRQVTRRVRSLMRVSLDQNRN